MHYFKIVIILYLFAFIFQRPGKTLWQSACDSYDDSSPMHDKQRVLSTFDDQQQLLSKRSVGENIDNDNHTKRLRQW